MKKLYYGQVIILFLGGLIINAEQSMTGDIEWKTVYIINNTDEDLTVEADVQVLPNINDLSLSNKKFFQHEVWNIAKRDKKFPTTQRLEELNHLHNITLRVQDMYNPKLPQWMKQKYPIRITKQIPGKVLIIYVGKTSEHWLISQRYVEGVKMVYNEGPAGYRLDVDQP